MDGHGKQPGLTPGGGAGRSEKLLGGGPEGGYRGGAAYREDTDPGRGRGALREPTERGPKGGYSDGESAFGVGTTKAEDKALGGSGIGIGSAPGIGTAKAEDKAPGGSDIGEAGDKAPGG